MLQHQLVEIFAAMCGAFKQGCINVLSECVD